MKYILYKRFKGLSLSGYINLPKGTKCEMKNNIIYFNNLPLMYATSENAHNYFTQNEDEQGILRGELINNILNILNKNHKKWYKIFFDPICLKYKNNKNINSWVWDHQFYIANLKDLQYILNLLKEN